MRILQDRSSIKSYKELTSSKLSNVSPSVLVNYTDDFKVNHATLKKLWCSLGFRDMEHVVAFSRSNHSGGVKNDIKLLDFVYDEEVVQLMNKKHPVSTAKKAPSELQSTVKHFVALVRESTLPSIILLMCLSSMGRPSGFVRASEMCVSEGSYLSMNSFSSSFCLSQ
mmetsp:Transcript_19220/g.34207  ORF Transcript_19220/g.34207 Transcript_19220/m.34207 type:complete len:167 (-) Transcript_19220:792-1292(-)